MADNGSGGALRARSRRKREAMPRAMCPDCQREVPAYVPRGGDGSRYALRKHICRDGKKSTCGLMEERYYR